MAQQNKKETTETNVLKEQLVQKDVVIEDYTNQLKRLQAEFENFVKRVDKERKELIVFSNENLIKKLLIVVDDFERAVEQLKKANVDETVMKGIELVAQGFNNILATEGLKQIDAKGKLFDPFVHEVVTCIVNDNCPENTVIEEIQKGYLLGNRPLRCAKVIISKTKINEHKPEGGV